MSVAYIICKVLPGLFENEYYVMVNGSSAYYVNRDSVIKLHGTPETGLRQFAVFRFGGTLQCRDRLSVLGPHLGSLPLSHLPLGGEASLRLRFCLASLGVENGARKGLR